MMSHFSAIFLVVLAAIALPVAAEVSLHSVASGLSNPVTIVDPDDGSGRRFIGLQNGQILILREDGSLGPIPLADLSSVVSCCENAEGLLSVAVDPHFAVNQRIFVQYVGRDENTFVSSYVLSTGALTVLLEVPQPADNRPNHDGGQLLFGPDGYLYGAVGDGGTSHGVTNRAQQLDILLGKAFRIDVSGDTYAVPPSNPLVSVIGARPEIWALGLRNPWRMSFDRSTGDLWIGDVGENIWEEVDLQPASSRGGENYGWPVMEGRHCFGATTCATGGLTLPVIEYGHGPGCAVTGGYVYRGSRIPELYGSYVYGDYCSGQVWAASKDGSGVWTSRMILQTNTLLVSFGEDHDGELQLVDYRGTVYDIEPATHRRRAVGR